MQETGKLIVGREIKMKGEITSCERLVVEGSVEAALMDSRALEVASGGYFTGTAVVDSAQIAGHFEGDLTVEGLLTLASTGRIIGTIRFGELEVERGGTMTGDVAIAGTPARAPALRGSEG
jgi:cytoskeletal protein CcmA (bactofilin family)